MGALHPPGQQDSCRRVRESWNTSSPCVQPCVILMRLLPKYPLRCQIAVPVTLPEHDELLFVDVFILLKSTERVGALVQIAVCPWLIFFSHASNIHLFISTTTCACSRVRRTGLKCSVNIFAMNALLLHSNIFYLVLCGNYSCWIAFLPDLIIRKEKRIIIKKNTKVMNIIY